jgi:hypothetical protein
MSANATQLTAMLVRALVELSYVESAAVEAMARGLDVNEAFHQICSAEGREIVNSGMELLGLKDLSEETTLPLIRGEVKP